MNYENHMEWIPIDFFFKIDWAIYPCRECKNIHALVVLCYYLVVRLGALYMQCIHIFHLKKAKSILFKAIFVHTHTFKQPETRK